MEFRCRLGTPGGEIVEGVYVADSESSLRHELEEKGLFVLSLQSRSRFSLLALGNRRRRVTRQEFLVFNQELATLLKAGMPHYNVANWMHTGFGTSTFAPVGVNLPLSASTAKVTMLLVR